MAEPSGYKAPACNFCVGRHAGNSGKARFPEEKPRRVRWASEAPNLTFQMGVTTASRIVETLIVSMSFRSAIPRRARFHPSAHQYSLIFPKCLLGAHRRDGRLHHTAVGL